MAAQPEKGCPDCARLRDRIAELELRLERFEGVAARGDLVALCRVSYSVATKPARIGPDGEELEPAEVRRTVYEPGDVIPREHTDGLAEGVHFAVR